jgi:AdoMet-dependent heme synthase
MLNSFMYQGSLSNLKRLHKMTPMQQMRYLIKVAVGETLPIRTPGTFGLRLVEISLTDRCQCRCGHCFAATKGPKDELKSAEVERLLKELRLLGVPEVCYSGGEPLLHPDIVSLVASSTRKGFMTRLISNGVLLDEKMVVALKRAGLTWCSVSLDGPSAQIHDGFRGFPGCFERVVKGLKHLVHHGIPCSIITVARRDLMKSGGLEAVVKLGESLGVSAVRINFPVPLGRFSEKNNQVLTGDERNKARELLRYRHTTMESPKENTNCKAGITKVNVLPNGNVTPCVFVPIPYGNIRTVCFSDIWKQMRQYPRAFKIKGQCPVCDPAMNNRIFETAGVRLQSVSG